MNKLHVVLPIALGLLVCAVTPIARADSVIGKLLRKAGLSAEQADRIAPLLEPFVEDNLAFRLVGTAEKLVVASKLEAATLVVRQNPSDENLRAFGEAYKAHSELLRVERFLVRLKKLLGDTEWARLASLQSTPKSSFDEARVRKILADITLGKVLSLYQQHHFPSDIEAVRRWQRGVRLTNAHWFARVIVPGKGWQIVYRGTQKSVNGMNIRLTTDVGDPAERHPEVRPGTKYLTLNLDDDVKMQLVRIPAGRFVIGSVGLEKWRGDDEGPQRHVTISKPFYMGVTEVTQDQYVTVMRKNPSKFPGLSNPVEEVSWNNAVEFCKILSRKTGKAVRLPTEAEWEYACRAGSKTRYSFGNDEKSLGMYAWHSANSDKKTHPVGQKKPNSWGLYDMHGNVYEWCGDWYGKSYVGIGTVDSQGVGSGRLRVLRGGSWRSVPWYCRSAFRHGYAPDVFWYGLGFRVVCLVSAG